MSLHEKYANVKFVSSYPQVYLRMKFSSYIYTLLPFLSEFSGVKIYYILHYICQEVLYSYVHCFQIQRLHEGMPIIAIYNDITSKDIGNVNICV